MSSIDFPDSPTIGDTFTVGQVTWQWDGTTWKSASLEEAQYLLGVTSSIQDQLDGKAATSHTHIIAEITDLTATATELNYTDGVTSSIQTQLDEKASISGTETLTNKTLSSATLEKQTKENITSTATGFAGYTFDVLSSAIQYITANSTANGTINFRASDTVTMNSFMNVGQSATCAVLLTNGATPYYPTTYQIDGVSITPKWQGGEAPTAGNANSIDIYTFTILKTADATYTLLASQTQFA